jgi:hypothetical protein
LTADESGVSGLYEWGNIYLAEGGQISIGGSAVQDVYDDVSLTQVMSDANDRGLLLNDVNRLYFEDDNVATGLDQFIGSSGSGTTLISSPQLDIAASSTLNLTSSGSVAFTSATTTDITSGGNLTLTTPAASKLIFNTNTAGTISHTSALAIEDLTIEQLGAVDASLILSSAGTGVDAIAISASAGGIDITATGNADTEDLDITTVGTTTELRLTSASTDADAIELDAEAGGIIAKVFDGKTLQLSNANADAYIKLNAHGTPASETIEIMNSAGTPSGAIAFTSAAGGINIDAASGKDVGITGGQIALVSEDNAASAISLTTNQGTAETIVLTNTLGTDPAAINLEASAGGVLVSADGSLADAIKLNATAGGIDIFASGAATGEDIDIVATGSSVNIESTESDAAAIVIKSTVGGIDVLAEGATGDTDNENIDISATGSSVIITSTEDVEDAIVLTTTHGGIEIWAEGAGVGAGDDIDIAAIGSSVNIKPTENVNNAILLWTNGGVSESIKFHADQGTGAGSIELTSDAGGIDINAPAGIFTVDATNFDVDAAGAVTAQGMITSTVGFTGPMTSAEMISASPLTIRSTASAANAVLIETASGSVASSIMIHNDTGTSATEDAASIQLLSDLGGIGIKAGLGVDVTSTLDLASSIYLQENGGTSGTIKIHANLGEVEGSAAGTGSILLASDAGGIGLSWADGKDLWAEGGRFVVTANEDAAEAIKLHADAGALQTIQLINDAGTASGAIAFTSSAGGVTVDAASGVAINSTGGAISIGDGADAQAINVGTGAANRTITIGNNTGTSGIVLTSASGKINLNGDVSTSAAQNWYLLDNDPSALSFDTDQVGILEIVTSNGSEKVKMSGGLDVTSNVNFDATTASSSATTGALVVDGGVGVAGNVNIAGYI